MDRFQAMQLFARIVELGSFSKAAEQQGMSRASASALIRQLESHLGVRLLQRTTRQVSATLDGRSYYQHCLSVLGEIKEVESVLSQSAGHPRGRLKIDLPASLGRLLVIPALPDFYARYPEIVLEIGIGDRMIDLVREGVDCVVRIGGLSDSTLIARSLPALPQVTCASAGYLVRHGLPSSLDELEGHRCIDYLSATTGRLAPLEFAVDGRIETRSLPASLAVNHGEAYVAACEAGLGIVQVPRYHVERQLAAGSLVELLPQYSPPALPLTVLYPHHRHLTPRLRVFIDWLVALFG
ncbi:LysR family transcriptional regulator [Azotobacter chroococcum]|uniref:LysR family transcriptional regulator n=1 Tax=Azotobacter chroococcum TaxID=353 RepID=UPI00103AEA0A|nr:LysR family transcriptional regulator [Azotobacter chroococcum]TBW33308.1 LysR family transcriptional regulator [Azotobacter chroococcum]